MRTALMITAIYTTIGISLLMYNHNENMNRIEKRARIELATHIGGGVYE